MGVTVPLNELAPFSAGVSGIRTVAGGAFAAGNVDLSATTVQSSIYKTGVYLPSDWGQFLRPKLTLAKAAAGKAVISVIGDSITEGLYASNWRTTGFVGRLRSALQAIYGDGGSGYDGAANSPVYQIAFSNGSVPTNFASSMWAQTGAWSAQAPGTNLDGPGAAQVFSTAVGATQTISGVRGTSVSVYVANFPVGTATAAPIQVQIDGATVGTITPDQSGNAVLKTTYAVAAGTHTVKFTVNGAGAAVVFGVSGENATGLVVNNFGAAAAISRRYNGAGSTYGLPADWSGGQSYPADCVLYCLGVNDAAGTVDGAGGAVAADTFADNMRACLTQIRDYGAGATGAVDFILFPPHVGKWEAASKLYSDYLIRQRALADVLGAAHVNMWALGRNSWNYWDSLGYWGQGDGTGAGGHDNVHPSDTGHAAMAAALQPILQLV